MQRPLHILLGALGGAVIGWAVCAGLYVRYRVDTDRDFGFKRFKKPVSESFWRVSIYVSLIGALIGAAITAMNVIL